MSNGIPTHDTFNRFFAALDPKELGKGFLDWTQSVVRLTKGEVIGIDGKTLRGSYDQGSKSMVHMVSAWASANNLILAQQKVEDQSNEITAIPALLEVLALSGSIVTIDAMGCRKEIASAIVDKKADYILAQPCFCSALILYCQLIFVSLLSVLTAMQDLKITLIQSDLNWEDIGANLAMFEEKIWQIGQSTDVIVLPEMFTTGFTMQANKLAEMMNLRTFKWMKQMADQTGALILGSFIAHVHERYYNRLLWMEPGGNFKTYDKRHLFRMAEEQTVYSQGESLLIGHWKGWRICPLICYDLRFPVWSRNRWNASLKKSSYDLLIYVANWPQIRSTAWETLLRARAIENLSYCVGVNRVGTDGNGIDYNGHSAIIGPKGDTIFSVEGVEAIKTLELNAHALQAYRDRFPTYLDADDFTIESEIFEEKDFLHGLS